ncbi:hypothetical protein ABIC89_002613 [Variovorax boronicumulans]|uniref:DUF1839 family protein n=1 Tax=Variovorax boronicumulans TaxID=436515 RepID=UPI00339B2AD1
MEEKSPSGVRIGPLANLDAKEYKCHALHSDDVVWREKNCYIDVWIELLHAHGLAPEAMLPFVIGIDFEEDQWTFCKPSHDDLYEIYGVMVNELTVWRPLLEHALEHMSRGSFIITEAPAFWLPDTASTDYRQNHTKTSIAFSHIDAVRQRMGYFHNAGHFFLSGEDFIQLFQLDASTHPVCLPLYAESVRFGHGPSVPADALRAASRTLWRKHLKRAPSSNPVLRFARRFALDLPAMREQGLAHYNAWAFATVRQLGAAFELAAQSLQWLGNGGEAECPVAAQAFMQIALDAKAMIFKGARAIMLNRPLDPLTGLEKSAASWETGLQALHKHFASK